jgi:hypothetical protein
VEISDSAISTCSSEIALKDNKIRKQINRNFNNIGSADKNIFKKSLQQFLPLSEAEIQGLHPAQAKLGYFLAWFQSLQLPSTQSQSPLALISLATKAHVSFKVRTQL